MLNGIDFQPVIILGAPRSGTNMLRDCLTMSGQARTWNCDEINLIWKYGNYSKSDVLTPKNLDDRIKSFIRKKFKKLSSSSNSDTIIEKTCANCLRPNFVNRVLPEAKYILLFRNGFEVIPSVIKRWNGTFEGNLLTYRLKKVKYVPLSYVYFIAKRFVSNPREEKSFFKWGPDCGKMPIEFMTSEWLAFYQWRECVLTVIDFFDSVPVSKFKICEYDNFVENPKLNLINCSKYIGKDLYNGSINIVANTVSKRSFSAWSPSDSELGKQVTIVNEQIKKFIENTKFRS